MYWQVELVTGGLLNVLPLDGPAGPSGWHGPAVRGVGPRWNEENNSENKDGNNL